MESPTAKYRFGPYELRTRTKELYKHGVRIRLRPQPCRVLEVLLEHAGELVSREELRSQLWPSDTFVDFEHGLNTSVKELRAVLSDSADEPRYIETLPKLGYRIIMPVEVEVGPPAKIPSSRDVIEFPAQLKTAQATATEAVGKETGQVRQIAETATPRPAPLAQVNPELPKELSSRRLYEFGPFRLDAEGRLLFRRGERMALPPEAIELLVVLVEARGYPLGKDELLKRVWVDTIVEEGSLTSQISLLRRALGRGEDGREVIETIPKRGYRFIGHCRQVTGEAETFRDRVMLVVLPFENLSGGEKHDYFSEGLTEEMISQLARLSPDRMGVIARTSAMKYKSTEKSIQQIGRELAVSHALEGSVRRVAGRVRITAQLILVSDETHLWSESYERGADDLLALQIEVAKAIAREVEIKLTPREQKRMERTSCFGSRAYEDYLKGRHLWNGRTEEGMRKSIEFFNSAIGQEPGYAAAYDGIADVHTMLACRGISPARETFHKAKTAARRALQIEPDLGEAYASLAHVRLHDWDWVGLEQDFQRAIDLNPGHAIAYYWYAEYLMATGRAEESIAAVRQSQRADPLNSVLNASVAMILYLARRYDEAREELTKALVIDPNHFLLHFRLGLILQQLEKHSRALEEMEKSVELSGRSTETLAGLAQAHAAMGRKTEMGQVLAELEHESKTRYVSPYNVARVYGSAAERDQAIAWLEKAYDEHNPDLIELNMEPTFDSLRSDPRFTKLLAQVGFN